MGAQPIICGNTRIDLRSAPINPAWIRGGTPVARYAPLSTSRDRASCTVVWDCTPGAFEWHYDTDETVHILEGTIVLEDGFAPPRRLGPGDVVLFPAGAVVRWTVETHVRKLAFFHSPLPAPMALVSRAAGKAKGALRRLRSAVGAVPASAASGLGAAGAMSSQADTVAG